jgi:hypothetical protein
MSVVELAECRMYGHVYMWPTQLVEARPTDGPRQAAAAVTCLAS